MLFLEKIIISILAMAALNSQSLYNGYGLGLIHTTNQISSKGAASAGLIPAFRKNISLDNPSTWQNLRFTTLNSGLSNHQISLDSGIENGSSELVNVQLIIPIALKYAFGFSLEPLTVQRTFLRNDSTVTIFDGDSLFTYTEIRSGGGLSVFTTAFSWPLNNQIQLGLKLEYLFGSSRYENLFKVNNNNFRAYDQIFYEGLLFKGYFNGQALKKEKFNLGIFGSFGMTLNELSAQKYSTRLFEDINNNNIYDINDYPDSLSRDTLSLINIYKPSQFSLGLNIDLKNGINLISEIDWLKNGSRETTNLSILPDVIGEKFHLNFGVIKFPFGRLNEWYDRFNYRGGIYHTSHTLKISGKSINESGYTLGIGFKFGAAGNQIDFAFKGGNRSISGNQKEKIKEFSIGISLGDKWFLRRRAR